MKSPIDRKTTLKGLGVTMGLPFLEAMASKNTSASTDKKFIVLQSNLGIFAPTFFPKEEGTGYKMPEVLSVLKPHRDKFTVFSNIDHGLSGGHKTTHTFLSGIKSERASGWPEGNISLDQKLAEHCVGKNRLSSLLLGGTGRSGGGWTRYGTVTPSMKATVAFERLFVEDDPKKKAIVRHNLSNDISILDAIRTSATNLNKRLGKNDQNKLDEYFTAVRESEKKIQVSKVWLDKGKPKVDYKMEAKSKGDLDLDVAMLALQTGSTRVVMANAYHDEDLATLGINKSAHALSHHSQREEVVKDLNIFEKYFLTRYGKYIERLSSLKDQNGESMLDSTLVMYGSGMGCGSRHSCLNMPIILAGAGLDHGRHINNKNEQPLNNLYLSIVKWFGIETNQFNTSKQTYTGFDIA